MGCGHVTPAPKATWVEAPTCPRGTRTPHMWPKWTPGPALLCQFVFTPTSPPAPTWGLRESPAPSSKLPHSLLFPHLWGDLSQWQGAQQRGCPWSAQRAVSRRTEDMGLSVQVTHTKLMQSSKNPNEIQSEPVSDENHLWTPSPSVLTTLQFNDQRPLLLKAGGATFLLLLCRVLLTLVSVHTAHTIHTRKHPHCSHGLHL